MIAEENLRLECVKDVRKSKLAGRVEAWRIQKSACSLVRGSAYKVVRIRQSKCHLAFHSPHSLLLSSFKPRPSFLA